MINPHGNWRSYLGTDLTASATADSAAERESRLRNKGHSSWNVEAIRIGSNVH